MARRELRGRTGGGAAKTLKEFLPAYMRSLGLVEIISFVDELANHRNGVIVPKTMA